MSTSGAWGSLTSDELARVGWHISSRSENGGGNCVEAGPVSDGTGRVAVRHSHHPHGRVITYSTTEWDAFTAGIRAGEFDYTC